MDCLRSFNFRVNANTNLTSNLKTWSNGLNNHYWAANSGSLGSQYNIEGFKNINIYGIDVIGSVQTLPTAGNGGVIVNDWSIDVLINGQQPLVGGTITTSPNFYGINTASLANKVFPLSKYSNSLKFADPFESVKNINLQDTNASGIGWETSLNVNLFWNLNFVVFYKFEGE